MCVLRDVGLGFRVSGLGLRVLDCVRWAAFRRRDLANKKTLYGSVHAIQGQGFVV